MNSFICETCGTQYAPAARAPATCHVCEDDRQYIGWNGQRWTTHDALAATHMVRIGEDAGLHAFALSPDFAIPQRMLLLTTESGNVLWESLSLVTDAAVQSLRERGGVDRIVISHPHFYASMVEWSDALGNVPILLHAADRAWIQRPARCIELWHGDLLSIGGGVTLLRTGGHFAGSTALHWATGPRGRGALFVGDSPQVASNRRGVSFMYSYPNFIPMLPANVRRMRELLAPFDYDDAFGFSWGRNIIGGARAAVNASFDRYLAAVEAGKKRRRAGLETGDER
jgi:glyoxylase-like metal-dependent hydrolase (beta-lactamase superfamily II)